MGAAVCVNAEIQEQDAYNREIEKKLHKERVDETGNQKLLLLGAGECGKSTILKQIRILHKDGFSQKEFEERRDIVYSNTTSAMADILRAMGRLDIHFGSSKCEKYAKTVLSTMEANRDGEPFSSELFRALQALWSDAGVQRAFARRSEYQIGDSARFFLNDLVRINAPNYMPSVQDMLMTRVPTSGIVEMQFVIKGCVFRVFDVGGQRSERRKWIHLFDDVNAIIFISAINEYNQTMNEDDTTNRLFESMDLFSQICNSKWFTKASMILFLNKKDVFIEKIATVPISILFKAYKGNAKSYDESMAFIKMEFAKLNETPLTKTVYTHETCATDTNQVQLVIEGVVDTVIGKNLRGTGLE